MTIKARATALLFFFLFGLTLFVQPLVNSGPGQSPSNIAINSDGSVDSSTIFRLGNTYGFTANITGVIQVHKSNIIVNGYGYTLKGVGYDMGFWLNNVNNVTIMNLTIEGFTNGIYCTASSYNHFYGNNLSANIHCAIDLNEASNYNEISDNNITNNLFAGIRLGSSSPNSNDSPFPGSSYNKIFSNKITENPNNGILITNSSNNELFNNQVIANGYSGICVASSSGNQFYLNNLTDNPKNAIVGGSIAGYSLAGVGGPGANAWDNGSVGNYWSDYLSRYPNASQIDSSGIGNIPYVIDKNNTDRYPLMTSYGVTSPPSPSQQQHISTQIILTIIGVSVIAVAAVTIGLEYYFRKNRH